MILGLNLHVKYHDGRFCFVGCHENEHPQWGNQYFGFNYFKMRELLSACGLIDSSISSDFFMQFILKNIIISCSPCSIVTLVKGF